VRIPSYRLHKPTGQGVVTLNGRDHYLGKHRSKPSLELYDRLIAEWLTAGRQTVKTISETVTVAEIAVAYLKHSRNYYKSSEHDCIKLAIRPLAKLYSRLTAIEYGTRQHKAVRQQMILQGWTRKSINHQMRRIVRMFKWSVSEGLLKTPIHEVLSAVEPLKQGRTEARESEPVKPIDSQIVALTIAKASPIIADMIRLQLLTGCRPGEVCALTPSMIERSGDVWEANIVQHKTAHHGATRTLYIGPEAQAIVTRYLNRGDDDCLFRPIDSEQQRRAAKSASRKTPKGYGNGPGTNRAKNPKRKPGERYTSLSYARAIRRICESAAIDHWSPNQLRHTRGTDVRAKYGVEAASAILGHSKIETSQIYAEKNAKLAKKVAQETG
jgi:integrase